MGEGSHGRSSWESLTGDGINVGRGERWGSRGIQHQPPGCRLRLREYSRSSIRSGSMGWGVARIFPMGEEKGYYPWPSEFRRRFYPLKRLLFYIYVQNKRKSKTISIRTPTWYTNVFISVHIKKYLW